jgi:hypothetical protein
MSRKFSFTVSYAVPVEELHRAITTDEMWQARFADAETATLELSHPGGSNTIRVHMTERAKQDRIPSIVRKVLKSELLLERTDNWGPLAGETARGSFIGASKGITTEMAGTYELRSTAEGSEIEVSGTVTVKVPLVGGAIEPLAEQLQHRVVDSERRFIENWLAARASA